MRVSRVHVHTRCAYLASVYGRESRYKLTRIHRALALFVGVQGRHYKDLVEVAQAHKLLQIKDIDLRNTIDEQYR